MTILYIYSALFSLPKGACCVIACAHLMCFRQLSPYSVSNHCSGQGNEEHLTTVFSLEFSFKTPPDSSYNCFADSFEAVFFSLFLYVFTNVIVCCISVS